MSYDECVVAVIAVAGICTSLCFCLYNYFNYKLSSDCWKDDKKKDKDKDDSIINLKIFGDNVDRIDENQVEHKQGPFFARNETCTFTRTIWLKDGTQIKDKTKKD